MAKLPDSSKNLVTAMDAARAKEQGDGLRPHLGASLIGDECHRKLWYTFRWFTVKHFSGRLLRLFDRGHEEEPRFERYLGLAGVEVSGAQSAAHLFGGHFGGECDGFVLKLPEAPRTKHVAEYKTHNDKSFKGLLKDGVKVSKPLHYAQGTTYMGLLGVKDCLYLAVNKNDDSIYSERFKFSKPVFDTLVDKAHSVIFDQNPPMKISQSATHFKCKWCDYSDVCHYGDAPNQNCRTCTHSEPKMDGTWYCNNHEGEIPLDYSKKGCGEYKLHRAC